MILKITLQKNLLLAHKVKNTKMTGNDDNPPINDPVDDEKSSMVSGEDIDDVQEVHGVDIASDSESEDEDYSNDPVDIDLEIVGLLSSTNGRSCSVHSECGRCVVPGDILRLKETIVSIGDKMETVEKPVLLPPDVNLFLLVDCNLL
jgi:hypothetical protein